MTIQKKATVYDTVQGGAKFGVFGWNAKAWKLKLKNIEHYYSAVLFIRLQKIVQTSKTVDGILIKAKATVQLLPVVLFIMHYKVFLISETVNEIP